MQLGQRHVREARMTSCIVVNDISEQERLSFAAVGSLGAPCIPQKPVESCLEL